MLTVKHFMFKINNAINSRCGRSDTIFLDEFPEVEQSIKMLLNAITRKRQQRGELILRTSKNGTPQEREQRQFERSNSGTGSTILS